MSGLQTFIAVFGGKEFSNRRLYSLTYGELRTIYFRSLRIIGIILLLFIGIMMALVAYSNNAVKVNSNIEPAPVKLSPAEKQAKYPGIGYATGIKRKPWQ